MNNMPMALVGKKNPILTEVAAPVLREKFDSLESLCERMLATCRVKGGIAIAAPQVGVSLRLIVTWDAQVIINPQLDDFSEEMSEEVEGCLSLPGRLYRVERPVRCSIQWQDLDGKDGFSEVEGLDARMFQHEIDHLDGILISSRGVEVPNLNHGAMKF